MSMRTVYHPKLPVSRRVDATEVEQWRAAGWRLTKPKTTVSKTPAPNDAADQGQHSDEGEN